MSEAEESFLDRPYVRFALAAVAVAAAFLLRQSLVWLAGAELPPYITFYPAIMVVALLCGLWPGLAATALAALAADYWILPPHGSFAITNLADAIGLAFFAAMGVFLSLVAEAYRRNRRRVAALRVSLALQETEARLLESLRQQAEMMRLSFDAIIVWRLGGSIESWNSGAQRLYGYSEGEALGHVTHELLGTIHPVPWPEIETALRRCGHWEGELRHTTKDGRGVTVAARHQLIVGVDGVERVLETNRNISEQKKAEAELKQSEEQFRALANAIPQLCWMANADGGIFWYNQRWYDYTGTTPEQMEGWGWKSVHDPEALPKVIERWQASIATGEPFDMVFPLRGAGGVFRAFLTRVMPVKDADGKVVRWFGTNTDIHAQKKFEAELKQLLEYRRLALDAAELALWDYRLDSGEVHWDERCRTMFGISDGDRLDYDLCIACIHPDDRAGVDEAVKQAVAGADGGSYHREFRVVWPDGSVHWILSHGRVHFEGEGEERRAVRFLGLNMEITGRKQAEEDSKNSFFSLSNFVPQLVWMCTPDGLNIYFNQRWVDYTGLTLEESYGRGWNTPFHPDDKQLAWDAWNRAVQSGGECPYSVECRLRAADGSYRRFLIRGEPMRQASGEINRWLGTCTDVEDLRQESEGRFRSVVENMSEGLISFDTKGNAIYHNPASLRILALEAKAGEPLEAELLKARWMGWDEQGRLLSPDEWPTSRIFREGRVQNQVLHVQRIETGHEFDAIYNGSLLHDSAGNVTGGFITIHDITERKQAELAQARLAAIVESSADAIISKSLDGTITSWNKSAERMFGYSAEEIVGQPITRIVPLDRLEEEKDILDQLRRGQCIDHLETVRVDKSGRMLDVSLTISPIRDSSGNVLGASKILRDITDRKRVEKALQESEHRWATTLQSIGDGVISTDVTGRIEFMNAVAEKLTGWPLEEARGRDLSVVFDIVQELTRVKPESPVAKVIRSGAVVSLANHTLLIRRDGTEIPIEDSAAPIRDNRGSMEGVVLVFHDCVEQRRMAAALRSNERLATTGRLAATIAHEIHNPLDAVGNLLYLIGHDSQDDTTKEYAATASAELGRVTQMTQQMLAFQREGVKPVPVKIGEILANVVAVYDRKIQTAGIRLDMRNDFHGHIVMMPGELRQILANLVGNAVEAVGPRSGRIALRAYASRDRRRGVPGLCVVVADDGPGIPAEFRSRIFEPFFTTKGEGGTGLGLWIISDILRKYDGALRLRSCTTPERSGTCFSVFLPLQEGSDSAASPRKARETAGLD